MFLSRLSITVRLFLVLAIGVSFQAGLSILSLMTLRRALVQARTQEVKNHVEIAYSTVAYYHDRAQQGLMTEAQAQEAARSAVRAMHYDHNNYFFIWDLDGKGIAHGSQPALEGKTFIHSPEVARNPVVAYMVSRLIAVARSPAQEGVTTYRIPKAGQTQPLEKIAYSRLFQPWGWSIGTGAYVDDIDAAFRAQAWSQLRLFLAMIALASALTLLIGIDLAQALNRLARRLNGVAQGDLDREVEDTERKDEVGTMARSLRVLRDTSREAAELRLDLLTGLPLRKRLMDRLREAKARSGRSSSHGAVLLFDLDDFKAVNDSHGHDAGDQVLREAALRLKSVIRAEDTLARLGGDQFVAVITDLGKDDQAAAIVAESIAEKMLARLNQTFRFGANEHFSSASVGITLFLGDAISSEDLLKHADQAMYRAKNSGGNVCRFFGPHMEEMVAERARQLAELRQAVAEQQFLLYYQPQMGPNGELKGCEALVRWQHPVRGLVGPSEFIPLAEETGLIQPLGQWVLTRACQQLAIWAQQMDTAELILAVNVSARQFQQPDFVDHVRTALQDTGADPARLMLELTESLLVSDLDDVIAKMVALQRIGVQFALDDFGTGYSSLYHLKRLPFAQLKIDRSFVQDVLTDANDAAIARMIVALAGTLGLEVLTEGVENVEQVQFLAKCGCRDFQGFLFSRPLPVEEFNRFAEVYRLVRPAP